MRSRYLFIPILFLSGCVGVIGGDLQYHNIDKDLLFKSTDRNFVYNKNTETFLTCNNKSFRIKFEFDIEESSWSTTMTSISILTLGLLPLYSTNNVDMTVYVYKDELPIHVEKIDSRAHFFFGIIPILLVDSDNSMNCNEGEGISGCIYKYAKSRALGRISKVLRESEKLKLLCN